MPSPPPPPSSPPPSPRYVTKTLAARSAPVGKSESKVVHEVTVFDPLEVTLVKARVRVRVRVRVRRGDGLRSHQPGLPPRPPTRQVFGEGGALAQSGCQLSEPHFFFKAGSAPAAMDAMRDVIKV